MKSIKNKFFSSLVLIIFIFTTSGNNSFSNTTFNDIQVITEEDSNTFQGPYNKNGFYHFKEALAFKESGGRYSIVNTFGYLGKYQFCKGTLLRFDIVDTKAFLESPDLQEKAFIAYCKVNKWILRKDIKRSVGKKINGIVITESGILAAAHLAGAGNIKKFLRSKGVFRFEDGYGTTIEQYMYMFRGYDTSNIEKDRLPKLG
ncbi:peptidoglycan-binding protein LysM [Flavicella sp.]|uniref:peptidoglycan-binding protein LysM n=1 Tax=Flavicella sp. TaxID=2957742 RepID=UPI0030167CDC